MIFGKKKTKELTKKDTGWVRVFAYVPCPLFDGGYVWLQPVLKRTFADFWSDEYTVLYCLDATKNEADRVVKDLKFDEEDYE